MNIDSIVRDWAYKVNDGCPDPKNRNHFQILEDVLKSQGYSHDFISSYLSNVNDPNKPIKEFQKLCVNIGKIISEEKLLTEASVWDKAVGTELISVTNTDALFTAAGESPPKGPFFVQPESKDAKQLNVGGSADHTVYIKASDTGVTYAITGSKNKLKKMFGNVGKGKSGGDVTWNENTLESAACTGLYFDAIKHYNKLTSGKATDADQQAAISDFEGALRSESGGASGLKGKLNALPDLLAALELAIGVQKFAAVHGCKGWNFIHKSIGKYYSAGEKNDNLDKKGFKDNTADTIITKSPASTLIANIAKDKVTFDSSGKCKTESGDEFYQISNKKSDGGAQLGRIVKSFRDMYGTKSPNDTWRLQLTKEFIEYGNSEFLLNEGLKDYFKQGLTYIKDKFVSAFSKIKSKVSSFSKTMIKSLSVKKTKPSSSLDKFMKSRFKSASKQLKEAKSSPKKYSYSGYASLCGQLAMQGNMTELKSLHSKATGEWQTLKKLLDVPNDGIDGTKQSSGPVLTVPKSESDGAKYALKLMINFMAYEHLTAMLKSKAGNVKEVSTVLEEFVELEKEMYFGRTELPLFKVYGVPPSGKAYEYLKSGKEFREDRLKAMDMNDAVKDGQYIPGVVVDSKVQKGKGHTSVKMWILHSISESGTQYTQVDLRSGSEDTLSFSVSGGSIKPGRLVLGKI